MGEKKVELRQVMQVCVVCKDLEQSMKNFWEIFGVGPWDILDFVPPHLTETTIHGKAEPYSMRLACAMIGSVQIELIQPLTGRSIYAEFLEEHGEGLHHIFVITDDYDEAVAALAKRGIGLLMSGNYKGTTYAYMDTQKALGTILEIGKLPEGWEMPPADAKYPPSA